MTDILNLSNIIILYENHNYRNRLRWSCFGSIIRRLGNDVICVDNDNKKINLLKKGIVPIYEPGLEEILKKYKIYKELNLQAIYLKRLNYQK